MKKTLFRLGMGMLLLSAFASCQKLGPLTADYFTVNPNPLEVKAGKVSGVITANFPEKYFAERALIEVTPVLKYPGGEALSTPSTYQGSKVAGNGETIQYKAGGTVTQNFSFDYVPEMANSTLWLRFKATMKDKEVEIPEIQIAVGCLATSTLADASIVTPAYAAANFMRDTVNLTEASIMFKIQNADAKCTSDIKDLVNKATKAAKCNKKVVNGIEVVAAASPDGGVELNEKLAARRQKNTESVLKNQKNKAPVDAKYVAQDWEGLLALVQNAKVDDKDMIIRILNNVQDPAAREAEIKKLSAAYKELADSVLPKLRKSDIVLSVTHLGKSDEQIMATAKNAPDSLNVEELLYAAAMACKAGNKEDAAAITAANATKNATDWRTTNNLGATKFAQGDMAAAAANVGTSVNNGGSEKPETNFNLALLALNNNQPDQAKNYLNKATGVENLGEAQGVMYIENGDYDKAVQAFGDKASNNAALAQMLVGNNEKAVSILQSLSEKNAKTYYLLAICGARSADDTAVIRNLQEAVKLDATLGTRAASDIEFAKYWTVADFQAIAK